MGERLRFGILGTGNIARQFVGGLGSSEHCEVVAVGSRSMESARGFVGGYCGGRDVVATDYAGLILHSGVDAVYVSLPNSMHAEWTIRALEAGKHVLCEKPLAMSVAEGAAMFAAAKKAGKRLVEAFMYVSHPLAGAYLDAVERGELGEIKHIRTSFCYRTNKIAGNVRFDAALGGGALMDIGCYCLHFSRRIARAVGGEAAEPDRIHVEFVRHPTGVDEQLSALMHFPSGLTASFTCGMAIQADNTATISGTEAYIEIPFPWKTPVRAAKWTVARSTPPRQDNPNSAAPATPPRVEHSVDARKELYALEADDFALAVWGKKPPAITEADSMGNLRALDMIKAQMR